MKKFLLLLLFIGLFSAGCDVGSTDQTTTQSEEIGQTKSYEATPKTIQKQPKPQTQESSCNPNYSGCVPIASDVDCAGGSGNGPAYVRGPVYITGYDVYGLDRDGNGVGCE